MLIDNNIKRLGILGNNTVNNVEQTTFKKEQIPTYYIINLAEQLSVKIKIEIK
ncbi:hypothetical protein GCM10022422_32430 [Flavobacterium ginsengisoli]|uniref:Uncharacterized protein n=1 Tax=Flavobacterium ginsengisoli TaxID=871694 RepID=A0ABP7FRQ5_9FLAO